MLMTKKDNINNVLLGVGGVATAVFLAVKFVPAAEEVKEQAQNALQGLRSSVNNFTDRVQVLETVKETFTTVIDTAKNALPLDGFSSLNLGGDGSSPFAEWFANLGKGNDNTPKPNVPSSQPSDRGTGFFNRLLGTNLSGKKTAILTGTGLGATGLAFGAAPPLIPFIIGAVGAAAGGSYARERTIARTGDTPNRNIGNWFRRLIGQDEKLTYFDDSVVGSGNGSNKFSLAPSYSKFSNPLNKYTPKSSGINKDVNKSMTIKNFVEPKTITLPFQSPKDLSTGFSSATNNNLFSNYNPYKKYMSAAP